MKTSTLILGLFISLLFIISSCTTSGDRESTLEEGFRYSICTPLNPAIIEKGDIAKEDIMKTLEAFPWQMYLLQMTTVSDASEIYYSPSLEFENKANQHGILASAVGAPDQYEFYIFYKKPPTQKGGEDAIIYLEGQTKEDVVACVQALIIGDQEFLDARFE
ncbi:MAG: hypothetical protein ACRBFS_21200 [Aureispira sp.]